MRTDAQNRILDGAAAACLLAAFGVSLCVGRYPLGLSDILGALTGAEGMAAQVFWRLRLPRSLAVLVSGGALGVAGAVYQALLGNPLAAPDVVGVSGGATLGAAVMIVCFGGTGLAVGAFAGGLCALAAALLITRACGQRGTAGLVLSGILISALVKAGIMLLKTLADREGELAAIEFFTMGSFADITWRALPSLCGGVALGLAVLALLRRQIPLLSLGDAQAAALGVRVQPLRAAVLGGATLSVCAVSAHAGVIAFLPLIAPHAARLLLRGRSRGMLPLSFLLGALLLLGADVAARLIPGAELPVSVLTTALGVPMLVSLMVKGGRADA